MAEQDAPSSTPEPLTPAAPAAPPASAASESVAAATDAAVQAAAATATAEPTAMDQAAIDDILKQASFEGVAEAMASPAGAETAAVTADELKLPDFSQVMQEAQVSSIDLLRDVDLNVKIELGRSLMLVEDVLKLGEGSVVELDKLAGDPVDVFVNERLIARGEVLVLNDNFCVRINEILAGVKEEGM